MKTCKISSIAVAVLIIAACSSHKKSTTSTASATPPATTAPATAAPAIMGPGLPPPSAAKSSNGVFAPGDEELTAIQAKYKEVTRQTLMDGHAIYTGVCTGCHKAKSIYSRPEDKWQGIMDDMAPKAKLTDAQKDAVYKYVLAIKATQLQGAK